MTKFPPVETLTRHKQPPATGLIPARRLLLTSARGLDLSGTLEGAGGIGGLLARYRHGTGSPYMVNGASFYHADGNGNVTYLANGTGSADAAYRYDPFARWLAGTGPYATANGMRFSSKPWIAHNGSNTDGLYYYGYRFYDPNLQRWPNRDPIGERYGLNLYGFVGNNPINRIDPLGLWWWDGDYIEWGVGGLLGFHGGDVAGESWGGFAEGWSKGGQGVVNAFTGGLFDPEAGLFYSTFDQLDKDAFGSGTKCDSAFKFGNNMGRVAVGSLAAAGGAMAAESAGLIDTSVQANNVFRIMSKPLQRGFRIDKPHHGKWYHWHWWKW
jgi:RHS repeat-associated protein